MASKILLISICCLFVVCLTKSRHQPDDYEHSYDNNARSVLSLKSRSFLRSNRQSRTSTRKKLPADEDDESASARSRARDREDRGGISKEKATGNGKKQMRYTLFAIESPPGYKSINFENTIKFVKTSLDLIDEFDNFPEIKFFVDRKNQRGVTDDLPYRYSLLSMDLSQNETKFNLEKIMNFVKDSADLQVQVVDKDNMVIYVKTISGKAIKLDVEPTDTIEQIKAKIEEKEGVQSDYQKLSLDGGPPLDDEMKLSDYNIKTNSTIQAHFVVTFFVKVGTSMTVTLRAFQDDTIQSVKQKMTELGGGMTVDNITLKFEGRELDNSKRLMDYHIVDKTTVEAAVNQTTPAS